MALRLQGEVNGQRVQRVVNGPEELLAAVLELLDGCELSARRLEMVLGSLQRAAAEGRSWHWSSEQFGLMLNST